MLKERHEHTEIEKRSQEIQTKLKLLKQWDSVLIGDSLEEVCNELDIIIRKHLSRIEELIDEGRELELKRRYE